MSKYTRKTNHEWDLGNTASYERQIGTTDPPPDEDVVEAGSEFDLAFAAEFEISVPNLGECITRLENYAVTNNAHSVLRLSIQELGKLLDHLDEKGLKGFVKSFSLPLRSGRYEELASFKERDVDPWLNRRQLSLIARPMVPERDGHHAHMLIPVGLLRVGIDTRIGQWRRGKIDDQFAHSGKMKAWVGSAKKDWGLTFEEAVIAQLEAKDFHCLGGKQMTFYGAPKNPNLGDLDILAWHRDRPDILMVECKNLIPSRNLAEIIGALREFSGNTKDGKRDSLTKHLRRVE